AFTTSLREANASPSSIHHLEAAAALYQGSFLEGFSLGDSVAFEEWLLLKREALQREALAALNRLASYHDTRGEYGKALPYAQRQVELEPWQEEAQRQLMRLLALNGQRALAVAQYKTCRRTIAEQLGVEPATETTRLYEQIRDEGVAPGSDRGQTSLCKLTEPEQIAPTLSTASPSPIWERAGVRLALVGSGILLLIIAIVEVLMFFGIPFPGRTMAPPEGAVVSSVGKLVFACEDVVPPQICVLELRSGRITQVTDNLEFGELDGIAWSPDGEQIVFDAGPAPASGCPHNHDLYVINADGSDLRQLTSGDTSDHIPNWSPDGEWIAFNRNQELWLIRPDGTEARRLYGESGEFCVSDLSWSPDSQQIAFLGQRCPLLPLFPLREVWVINRDGTDPRIVHTFAQQPDSAFVHWEPDGLGLVCDHTYGDEPPMYLRIDSSGSGEPFLINVLPFEWNPNYWPQWGKLDQLDNLYPVLWPVSDRAHVSRSLLILSSGYFP
ncbi:MAG: BTAD domain-containing putative transcriptional regulator, partial [Anaerolineae bacterium]